MSREVRPIQTALVADTITALAAAMAGGAEGIDRELVPVTYRVKTAFTGASVGDVLTSLRVINLTTSSPAQDGGTIWYNETTAAVLGVAPAAANIEQVGTPGLTNAQFLAGLATVLGDQSSAEYEFVGASVAAQPLGATGAVGDFISHLIITPLTAAAGAVSLKDGTAGTDRVVFAGGGTTALPTLAPITVAMSMKSLAAGGWLLTTGANVQVHAVGNFT